MATTEHLNDRPGCHDPWPCAIARMSQTGVRGAGSHGQRALPTGFGSRPPRDAAAPVQRRNAGCMDTTGERADDGVGSPGAGVMSESHTGSSGQLHPYLQTLRAHRVLFALPVVVAAVIATWFVLGAPKQYQAGTSLWFDNAPSTDVTAGQQQTDSTGAVIPPAAQGQTLLNELLSTRHFRVVGRAGEPARLLPRDAPRPRLEPDGAARLAPQDAEPREPRRRRPRHEGRHDEGDRPAGARDHAERGRPGGLGPDAERARARVRQRGAEQPHRARARRGRLLPRPGAGPSSSSPPPTARWTPTSRRTRA